MGSWQPIVGSWPDYHRDPAYSEGSIHIAMIHRLLTHLVPSPTARVPDPGSFTVAGWFQQAAAGRVSALDWPSMGPDAELRRIIQAVDRQRFRHRRRSSEN